MVRLLKLIVLLYIFVLENANFLLFIALIGKFCVSAVFSVSLLFISELYPTAIRNTGLGTSLTVSQIGSVLAPYLVELLVMSNIHGYLLHNSS